MRIRTAVFIVFFGLVISTSRAAPPDFKVGVLLYLAGECAECGVTTA